MAFGPESSKILERVLGAASAGAGTPLSVPGAIASSPGGLGPVAPAPASGGILGAIGTGFRAAGDFAAGVRNTKGPSDIIRDRFAQDQQLRIQRQQNQRAESQFRIAKTQARQEELTTAIATADKLRRVEANAPEGKRAEIRETNRKIFEESYPELGGVFDTVNQNPGLGTAYPEFLKNSQVFKIAIANGDSKLVSDLLKNTTFIEQAQKSQAPKNIEKIRTALPAQLAHLRKTDPKLLAKLQENGIDESDIRQLNKLAPKGDRGTHYDPAFIDSLRFDPAFAKQSLGPIGFTPLAEGDKSAINIVAPDGQRGISLDGGKTFLPAGATSPIPVPGNSRRVSTAETGTSDELGFGGPDIGKKERQKFTAQAQDATARIAAGADILRSATKGVTGVRGDVSTFIGKSVGQISGDKATALARFLTAAPPAETAQFRIKTAAYVAGSIALISGEDSKKVSDIERRITKEAFSLDITLASFDQVIAAVQQGQIIATIHQDRKHIQGGNAVQHDELTPEGRSAMMAQFMDRDEMSEENATSALEGVMDVRDRLRGLGTPVKVRGKK